MQEVFNNIVEKFQSKIEALGGASGSNEVQDVAVKEIEWCKEIVEKFAKEFATDTNVGSNGWIPFAQREMTEDEKKSFGDFNFMLDCPLPDEDEEILITYKFKGELYVDVDTFMRDGSECYLDSGRDFVTEAVAWRKKPEPYQPKGE